MPLSGAFAVNRRCGLSPCSERANEQDRLCNVECSCCTCAIMLLTPILPDMPDMRLCDKDLRMSAE